jgi:guanylate kinase
MEEAVRLGHIEDFKQILEAYEISEHGKKILDDTKLVILVGIAGAGRNTIISELVKRGNYRFIISDTTRPPKVRNGVLEKNGEQYFFRQEDDFLGDLQKGEYLEAELIHNQQVSGISIRELQRAAATDKIAINEVEFLGSLNILKAKPDTISVFILPPSFEEWQFRLRGREKMSDKEFHNRMETAARNLRLALGESRYYFIVNDNFVYAANRIDSLVKGESMDKNEEQQNRILAKRLLSDVQKLLAQDTE